jgi:hypothetical protein
MTHRIIINSTRNQRRQRVLRKMASARAAKARKRAEAIASGWSPEPKMVRHYPVEFGVRLKSSGETAWVDLVSVRDASRRLAVVLERFGNG